MVSKIQKISNFCFIVFCFFKLQSYVFSNVFANEKLYPIRFYYFLIARSFNYRTSDRTMPEYWKEHFGKLNCEIPQGILGTNISGLFKDIETKIVYNQ